MASALDAVHETGLYHRDVKPANVLVGEDEEGGLRCRLTDFGLSKQPDQDSSPLTSAGFFVGTCQYVAPEQILAKDLDHRVDVYSLGCLLYECLAGEPPFNRPREEHVLYAHIQDPPPQLTASRPELPAAIDEVIEKALAKDPDARYPSCGELVKAAREALLSGAPSDARRPPRPLPWGTACVSGSRRATPTAPRSGSTTSSESDGRNPVTARSARTPRSRATTLASVARGEGL